MSFLRPIADDLDGGWTTDVGGTVLFEAIDETSANDADFIRSGVDPSADVCRVTLSDPSGEVDIDEAVTIRYRYAKDGAGVMDLVIRLKEGTTTRATWTHSGVSSSFATAAQLLTAPEKSAITDWSNLFLEFDASLAVVGDAYAVGGNSPELVVDFVADYYRKAGADSTFAGVLTFARASTGHYLNSAGVWTSVSSGADRRGHHIHNGSTWVNRGLLLETEARTNMLLNSGTLSTQSVTTTAVAHTLHFSGTGTVTLTGTSTDGPLVGTGTGEQNRVSLTFTPTAGTLTLTVSGTVTNAQLEIGSTPSSYIPTAGATVTRAAETLSVGAENWASSTALTWQLDGRITYADLNIESPGSTGAIGLNLVTIRQDSSNLISLGLSLNSTRTGRVSGRQENGGTTGALELSGSEYTPGTNVAFNIALAASTTRLNIAKDGTAATANTTASAFPSVDALNVVFGGGSTPVMMTIGKFRLWEDTDLGDTDMASSTA